jgi:hypothetical protein
MQIPMRLAPSKPERFPSVSGELETAHRGKIDILRQGNDLEAPTEHFRMKKRLQSPLRFFVGNNFRMHRDDSGKETMLIGESGQVQSIFLRRFSDIGPIDVRGDVGFPDLLEWRIEQPMLSADLDEFAEFVSGKAVINRNHKSAF